MTRNQTVAPKLAIFGALFSEGSQLASRLETFQAPAFRITRSFNAVFL